jgi:hypothetical protein
MAAYKPLVLVSGGLRQLSASDTLDAAIKPSTAAPVAVTVGASPYTYTATADGLLNIFSGTVTKLEYLRGAVYTEIGPLNSLLLVLSGDAIRVTYSAVPTLTFIAR